MFPYGTGIILLVNYSLTIPGFLYRKPRYSGRSFKKFRSLTRSFTHFHPSLQGQEPISRNRQGTFGFLTSNNCSATSCGPCVPDCSTVHTLLSSPNTRLVEAFLARTHQRIACFRTNEERKKDVRLCPYPSERAGHPLSRWTTGDRYPPQLSCSFAIAKE